MTRLYEAIAEADKGCHSSFRKIRRENLQKRHILAEAAILCRESRRGVKINYVYYNAKAFNVREVENQQVPVRYDPFDLGTAYAYVRGRWVQARSEHYLQLQGHSERELQIASAELRKQHQNHTRDAAITAKRLADFLADLSSHDTVLRQHWQDAEARDVFDQMRELPGSSSDQEESVPVLALVQTEPQSEPVESGATKPQRSRHRQPAVIIEDEVNMDDLDEYGRF